jgi:FAD/FMN-containing dehydrogenase/Fe-S oxidoreductase
MDTLTPDIKARLESSITGEVKTDPVSRILYSTDASIHKIKPLGVVFPRQLDELATIVAIAKENSIPIIPRGSGSGLAGQAIGNGLIIDCSRYLRKMIDINREEMTVTVEPGLVLDDLNREAKKYGLQFGPDPASSERATMGGCIGNNAAGAHSIIHGMTSDHILSAEVVLADGSVVNFKPINLEQAVSISEAGNQRAASSVEGRIYQAALRIRSEYAEEVIGTWPRTWRRTSGYNLNYLLPWSATMPPQWDFTQASYPPVAPDTINLAQVLVGSEGSLGVVRSATLRLVPIPGNTLLVVVNFPSIYEACDIVPEILTLSPSAVELIPQSLIHLARSVPAYANQLSFVVGDPAAMLAVEFSGGSIAELLARADKLKNLRDWPVEPIIAEVKAQQKQVWGVRNVGLGILMSRLGDVKPATFIEDMSVPVEHLAEFVSKLDVILKEFGTEADYYGHASAGCLHIRPLLNLKTTIGRAHMRSIAEAAVGLVLRLGGAISAEHGDGITRGEWIERAYGARVVEANRLLKQAADPQGIMNPGKIVDPPKMDTYLRYDEGYHPMGWMPLMTFSSQTPERVKIVEAIEQCNGVGVCRKSSGVMCPSFQATGNELYSTRGRANLLRAMISEGFSSDEMAMQAVKETLDKCLACKGCKAECPSAVDMAKLKYEFNRYYYTHRDHHRPLRDYLFGFIGEVAKIGNPFAPIVNALAFGEMFSRLREIFLGIAKERKLPKLAGKSLHQQARQYIDPQGEADCLLLADAFNEYFFPQTGVDALEVLKEAGCQVKMLRTIGAGRTLISKGFLKQARQHARGLVEEIRRLDPGGKLPVIGLEPSEIYTLKDEFLDFLPGDEYVTRLAERAYMVDEFLLRSATDGLARLSKLSPIEDRKDIRTNVLFHGHCYQKAQPPAKDGLPTGVGATVAMLEGMGYEVSVVDDGCCGMAGAFGYEAEQYGLSQQVGNLVLFPAIQKAEGSIIAAAGISCQSQIEDGTGRRAYHPISLVARRGSILPGGGAKKKDI